MRNLRDGRLKRVIIFSIICVILFGGAIFGMQMNRMCDARSQESKTKVITSVYVERGSSLWQYAREYYTEDYESMDAMIAEIKAANGMHDSMIHEGAYIIIPYYTSQ